MDTALLPTLHSEYPLTQAQIDEFDTKGHIRLDAVCTPDEIMAYRPVIHGAAMAYNKEHRPISERDTYGKAFLQVSNLWPKDEGVRRYVFAQRFASIAARLLGVASVRLYHDQALFKEPGGGITPWHQDEFYWPLTTDKTITLWMPMVEVTPEMGSMTFADGSHLEGFIPIDEQISDSSQTFFEDYVARKGFRLSGGGPMAAGDATFHTGWTLHKAPGNPTQTCREVMTVIYYDADAKIAEPKNKFQENDLKTWLGSLAPGSHANGPLNPVLWPPQE